MSLTALLLVITCSERGTESVRLSEDESAPSISSVIRSDTTPIDTLHILGLNFGVPGEQSSVQLNGHSLVYINWTDTLISFTLSESDSIPDVGFIHVQVGDQVSKGWTVADLSRPILVSVTPEMATFGSFLSLRGQGFGDGIDPQAKVTISGREVEVNSWTDRLITLYVSSRDVSGDVVVHAWSKTSDPTPLEVCGIHRLSSTTMVPGMSLEIYGTGFGEEFGSVVFGDISAQVLLWQDDRIVAIIPEGIVHGFLYIQRFDFKSNRMSYTVKHQLITQFEELIQSTTRVYVEYFGMHCEDSTFAACECDTIDYLDFPIYPPTLQTVLLTWTGAEASAHQKETESWEYDWGELYYHRFVYDLDCSVQFETMTLKSLRLYVQLFYSDELMEIAFARNAKIYLSDIPWKSMGENMFGTEVAFFLSGSQLSSHIDSLTYYDEQEFVHTRYNATDFTSLKCPPSIRVTFTGPPSE